HRALFWFERRSLDCQCLEGAPVALGRLQRGILELALAASLPARGRELRAALVLQRLPPSPHRHHPCLAQRVSARLPERRDRAPRAAASCGSRSCTRPCSASSTATSRASASASAPGCASGATAHEASSATPISAPPSNDARRVVQVMRFRSWLGNGSTLVHRT